MACPMPRWLQSHPISVCFSETVGLRRACADIADAGAARSPTQPPTRRSTRAPAFLLCRKPRISTKQMWNRTQNPTRARRRSKRCAAREGRWDRPDLFPRMGFALRPSAPTGPVPSVHTSITWGYHGGCRVVEVSPSRGMGRADRAVRHQGDMTMRIQPSRWPRGPRGLYEVPSARHTRICTRKKKDYIKAATDLGLDLDFHVDDMDPTSTRSKTSPSSCWSTATAATLVGICFFPRRKQKRSPRSTLAYADWGEPADVQSYPDRRRADAPKSRHHLVHEMKARGINVSFASTTRAIRSTPIAIRT